MSSLLIIKAKELLKKAKELNDPELIDIAISMLENEPREKKSNEVLVDDYQEVEVKQEKKKRGRPRKSVVVETIVSPQKDLVVTNKPLEGQKNLDFSMDQHRDPSAISDGKNYGRREPVKGGRNTFTDTLVDEQDKIGITPKIEPVERRPAFKLTKVVCSECGKRGEVHPIDATEFYRCPECKAHNKRS